jgi:H/ACA ribonucleoprotein complex subunit 4
MKNPSNDEKIKPFQRQKNQRSLLPFEIKERAILVKRHMETSPKYGCNPDERPLKELLDYGVVNIDKPKGPTSHEVSAFVQKILNIKKSGHSGTLDPIVTGVLAVAIGRATRIVQSLLTAGKEYVGVMHLHKEVDLNDLKEIISSHFSGKIKQLPPIKSAIKRQLRERSIYYFDVLEIDGQDVLFRTGVEAGTYIRKLCHDIGKKLGCGAHMAELRRTKAGPFKEDSLITLHDLTDAFYYYNEGNDKFLRACIQPIENAIKHLPKIWVLDTTIGTIVHGVNLKVPGVSKLNTGINDGDTVAVMSLKEELVAVGVAKMGSNSILKKDRGVAVRIEKVFMQEGVYFKS